LPNYYHSVTCNIKEIIPKFKIHIFVSSQVIHDGKLCINRKRYSQEANACTHHGHYLGFYGGRKNVRDGKCPW
jgi:hypothetical protein